MLGGGAWWAPRVYVARTRTERGPHDSIERNGRGQDADRAWAASFLPVEPWGRGGAAGAPRAPRIPSRPVGAQLSGASLETAGR
eukprot:gene77-biopygen7549